MEDYYQILGCEINSDQEKVKKGYYKLSLKYHPDKGGDQEKFEEISQAYEILGNEHLKYLYDTLPRDEFEKKMEEIGKVRDFVRKSEDISKVVDTIFHKDYIITKTYSRLALKKDLEDDNIEKVFYEFYITDDPVCKKSIIKIKNFIQVARFRFLIDNLKIKFTKLSKLFLIGCVGLSAIYFTYISFEKERV